MRFQASEKISPELCQELSALGPRNPFCTLAYANAMKAITDATWDACEQRMRNLCFELKDMPRELMHSLPRLVFQFNRRDIGRLRQMVDAINASAVSPVNPGAPRRPAPQ